jgi:hypothetical protein
MVVVWLLFTKPPHPHTYAHTFLFIFERPILNCQIKMPRATKANNLKRRKMAVAAVVAEGQT